MISERLNGGSSVFSQGLFVKQIGMELAAMNSHKRPIRVEMIVGTVDTLNEGVMERWELVVGAWRHACWSKENTTGEWWEWMEE
jgi:hypothetical protein